MLDISLPIAFTNAGQHRSLFRETTTTTTTTEYREAVRCLMELLSDEHRNSKKHKPYSVEDCLEAFTRTEYISDEYLCMACNNKRSSIPSGRPTHHISFSNVHSDVSSVSKIPL